MKLALALQTLDKTKNYVVVKEVLMTYLIFSVTGIGAVITAIAVGLVAKHSTEEAKYEKLFDIGLALVALSFLLMLMFFAGTDVGYKL
jgi:hypothetical protein